MAVKSVDYYYVKTTCPYCGWKQSRRYEESGKQIINCWPDDGGCGKWYVIDLYVRVEHITYRLDKVDMNKPSAFQGGGDHNGFGHN